MFGKGLRGALWAAAVLGAFFGASFGTFSTQARADEPGVTPDSITIGAFGPITGPAAYIGLAGRDGANLAIKEINAAGGINGREEYPKNEGDALTAQQQNWYQAAPVKRAEFNIGDKDFTPQLLDIQGADPQVIAIFGNPAEAAIAMRQAKELGINASFFLGTTMVDQSVLNVAKQAAEGASGFALLPLLPSSSKPEMKSWVAKWKQEYPNLPAGRPNVFDVLSYSDMYAVADAIKRAGKDLTTDRLIDALEATHEYRAGAIASPLTFTKKHHIGNLRLQAMQVKNGEWEPVAFEGKRESDILKRYQ
jgi:ABC-type branched-subunit amino acid transport system substrate-binding protein